VRAALFAERLRAAVLAPVAHGHRLITVPRVLRGLFQRDRADRRNSATRLCWSIGIGGL